MGDNEIWVKSLSKERSCYLLSIVHIIPWKLNYNWKEHALFFLNDVNLTERLIIWDCWEHKKYRYNR